MCVLLLDQQNGWKADDAHHVAALISCPKIPLDYAAWQSHITAGLFKNSKLLQVRLADSGVRQVRDAATVRGKAAELENLMSASVSSVHARSTAQHEALAAIIDQQTVISDALERQNLAAVTAQMLAESRDTAIKQIRKGYSEILNALQRAMAQEVVSEEALFALWGAARRRLLLEDKNAIMAATPCTAKGGSVMQYEKIRFTVDHQRASEISPQVLYNHFWCTAIDTLYMSACTVSCHETSWTQPQ